MQIFHHSKILAQYWTKISNITVKLVCNETDVKINEKMSPLEQSYYVIWTEPKFYSLERNSLKIICLRISFEDHDITG